MNGIINKYISFLPGTQNIISMEDHNGELLFVNVAITDDEVHFILRPMAKSNYLPLSSGNESSICLQLLIAHYSYCVGKNINNIYFHAFYKGGWKIVTFSDFEESEVKKVWPDRASSGALSGIKIVEADPAQWDIDSLKQEDVFPLVITMWHHADKSVSEYYSEDKMEGNGTKSTFQRFGDVKVYEYTYYDMRFHFSTDENLLKQQLTSLNDDPTFFESSEIKKGLEGIGYLCYSLHEQKKKRRSHDVLEPGEHNFSRPSPFHMLLNLWKDFLGKCGIDITYISDRLFSFEISKELDADRLLFLPGRHTIRLANETD